MHTYFSSCYQTSTHAKIQNMSIIGTTHPYTLKSYVKACYIPWCTWGNKHGVHTSCVSKLVPNTCTNFQLGGVARRMYNSYLHPQIGVDFYGNDFACCSTCKLQSYLNMQLHVVVHASCNPTSTCNCMHCS
jgi:hypothetical protein